VNAALAMAIMDSFRGCILQRLLSCYPNWWNIPRSPFVSIVICTGDYCLEILITFILFTLISTPRHLPISISLSIKPFSTISSLASSTESSAYFTVQITCPILKSWNPWTSSLVSYSLHKLKINGDKQLPFLTPLPVYTLLVSPWSNCTLTLWSMYKLLINCI